MKAIIKRVVVQMYCHELITLATAASLFDRFDLWKA